MDDESFVVVNLLTLKDQAALDKYAADAVPRVRALGAQLIHMGPSLGVMVGDEEDGCDLISVWRFSLINYHLPQPSKISNCDTYPTCASSHAISVYGYVAIGPGTHGFPQML